MLTQIRTAALLALAFFLCFEPASARVLQSGQSLVLQFTNLPYWLPGDASPPDQYAFSTYQLWLAPGATYRVELFADDTSQAPFFSSDYSSTISQGGIGTNWSDLQGAIRVTCLTGIVDLTEMWVQVAKGGDQYYGTFYAIPPTAPPLVAVSPTNVTVLAGSTTTLLSDGYGMPLSYQWQFNGTNLAGATNSVLVLTNAQFSNAGAYQAVLSNSVGASTTAVANVGVEFGSGLQLAFRPVITITGATGSTYWSASMCLFISAHSRASRFCAR